MKATILTFIGLLIFSFSYGQDISRSTITTAGGFVANDEGISISWSMGEVFSLTTESEQHITEGFQQGKLELSGKVVLEAVRENEENVVINLKKKGSFNATQFILQRRNSDEQNFTTIATIKNEKESHILEYIDHNNTTKNSTYRIQFFNYETKNLSNTVTIEGTPRNISMTIFPNPTVEQLNVELLNIENEEITINIWATNGQNVFSNTYQNIENQLITINDLKELAKGSYLIQVNNGTEIIDTKTFVKL